MSVEGSVYLIHLFEPLGAPDPHREERGRPPRKRPYKAHARHYLGWAKTNGLKKRLKEHRAGTGSFFLAAANRAGIDYWVARYWHGKDRDFERKLKNTRSLPKYCPECRAEARAKKAKNQSAHRLGQPGQSLTTQGRGSIMALVSLGEIAERKRKKSGKPRLTRSTSALSYYVRAYKRKENPKSVTKQYAFNLSAELIEAARLKAGDRVEILFDKREGQGLLKRVESGGYALTVTKGTGNGIVKATYMRAFGLPASENRVEFEGVAAQAEGIKFSMPAVRLQSPENLNLNLNPATLFE